MNTVEKISEYSKSNFNQKEAMGPLGLGVATGSLIGLGVGVKRSSDTASAIVAASEKNLRGAKNQRALGVLALLAGGLYGAYRVGSSYANKDKDEKKEKKAGLLGAIAAGGVAGTAYKSLSNSYNAGRDSMLNNIEAANIRRGTARVGVLALLAGGLYGAYKIGSGLNEDKDENEKEAAYNHAAKWAIKAGKAGVKAYKASGLKGLAPAVGTAGRSFGTNSSAWSGLFSKGVGSTASMFTKPGAYSSWASNLPAVMGGGALAASKTGLNSVLAASKTALGSTRGIKNVFDAGRTALGSAGKTGLSLWQKMGIGASISTLIGATAYASGGDEAAPQVDTNTGMGFGTGAAVAALLAGGAYGAYKYFGDDDKDKKKKRKK